MPGLLEELRAKRPGLREVLLGLSAVLLGAIILLLVLRRGGGPGKNAPAWERSVPENRYLLTQETVDALVYEDSTLGELRWKLSGQELEDLNRVLLEYEITSPEEISQFLAQAAIESLAGSALTEWGEPEYFQGRGYSTGTRGAGYFHLTYAYGQMAFSVWLMKKYVPGLEGLTYANPSRHGREEIAETYYTALQTAANMGLDVSRYSRVVYDQRDPAQTGYTTGADYIAEAFAWESAGYYWHIAGISEAFMNFHSSLNTDIASDIVGGSNWQSRREAYCAYYPIIAAALEAEEK